MSKYILLENGDSGYLTNCTYKQPRSIKSYWVDSKSAEYTGYYTPIKKERPDNRKYAYIYTKKGRVLATVDTKTFEAYKVEGCLTKTWKPIRRFVFDKWATLLNW